MSHPIRITCVSDAPDSGESLVAEITMIFSRFLRTLNR